MPLQPLGLEAQLRTGGCAEAGQWLSHRALLGAAAPGAAGSWVLPIDIDGVSERLKQLEIYNAEIKLPDIVEK